MLSLSQKKIYQLSYLYLALPLFLFLSLWVDWNWGLFFTFSSGIVFYKAYQSIHAQNCVVTDKKIFFMCVCFASVWCFFAGIGYFYYQSFDYHFRNAVFRDLINYSWPVFYNHADTPLVYYMAFWLPVAFVAKFFALFISNQDTVFYLANILLLLYAIFGVILILFHILIAVKPQNKKQACGGILIFLFFSGLDIVGFFHFRTGEPPFFLHLEWWSGVLQYSSITTMLFWVFNQFIPIALITLLIFNERNIQNFGMLITMSLFFSPYPTFGCGLLMIAFACKCFLDSQNKMDFLRHSVFSIQNLFFVFLILPVIILFFITNSGGISKFYNIMEFSSYPLLLAFLGCEVLIYFVLLAKKYYKNIFFITVVISLLVIPFIRTDTQNNFCMRASIPAIILLAIFTAKFIISSLQNKKDLFFTEILILVLCFASATPIIEFSRGIYHTISQNKLNLVADDIYSLNQKYVDMPVFHFRANHQFSAENYRTDFFWRVLAKHK